MAEKRIEIDDSDAEDPVPESNGETFELDSDWKSEDLEDVFEQAVAAVDRKAAVGRKSAPAHQEVPEDVLPEEPPPPPPIADASRDQMERLEKEVAALRDRLMRTLADFENYRKRTEREKESLRRFGLAEVLRDFLGVVDNLERASSASGNAEDLKTGVEMILRQYWEVLRRQGVEPISAQGQPFDPAVHEAVYRVDRDDVEAPTVIDEMQKGFLLHDRLLRPALVTVAMPTRPAKAASPAPSPPAETAGEGGEASDDGGGDDVAAELSEARTDPRTDS